MSSKVKQWKIGEYAVGGIIEARVHNEDPTYQVVEVKARDSEDPDRIVLADWAETDHVKWYNSIRTTLNEMTSVYHADQIMEWIAKEVTKFQTLNKTKQSI
jgi:hypothetical protein